MSWQDRGRQRKGHRDKSDVVTQARLARQQRQLQVKETKHATTIQAIVRGKLVRNKFCNQQRCNFAARVTGIAKLYSVLPSDAVLPLVAVLSPIIHLKYSINSNCTQHGEPDLKWCLGEMVQLVHFTLKALASRDPEKNLTSVLDKPIERSHFTLLASLSVFMIIKPLSPSIEKHRILVKPVMQFVSRLFQVGNGISEELVRSVLDYLITFSDNQVGERFFTQLGKFSVGNSQILSQSISIALGWCTMSQAYDPVKKLLATPVLRFDKINSLLPTWCEGSASVANHTLQLYKHVTGSKELFTSDVIVQMARSQDVQIVQEELADFEQALRNSIRLKAAVLHSAVSCKLHQRMYNEVYQGNQSKSDSIRINGDRLEDERVANEFACFLMYVQASRTVIHELQTKSTSHKVECFKEHCNLITVLENRQSLNINGDLRKTTQEFCNKHLADLLWSRSELLQNCGLVNESESDLKHIVKLGAKRVGYQLWKQSKAKLEALQRESTERERVQHRAKLKHDMVAKAKQVEQEKEVKAPTLAARTEKESAAKTKQVSVNREINIAKRKQATKKRNVERTAMSGNCKHRTNKQMTNKEPVLTEEELEARVEAAIALQYKKMLEFQHISERISKEEIKEQNKLVKQIDNIRASITQQSPKANNKTKMRDVQLQSSEENTLANDKVQSPNGNSSNGQMQDEHARSSEESELKQRQQSVQMLRATTKELDSTLRNVNDRTEAHPASEKHSDVASDTDSKSSNKLSQPHGSSSTVIRLANQDTLVAQRNQLSTSQQRSIEQATEPQQTRTTSASDTEEVSDTLASTSLATGDSTGTDRSSGARFILDGANIGYAYGRSVCGSISRRTFLTEGIELSLEYFERNYGKGSAILFLPQRFVQSRYSENLADDLDTIQRLIKEGSVAIVPAGVDDDLFLLEYFRKSPNTWVVTNDNFNDHRQSILQGKHSSLLDLDKRLIKYMFVSREFLPLTLGLLDNE